jgi:hypothetical protein
MPRPQTGKPLEKLGFRRQSAESADQLAARAEAAPQHFTPRRAHGGCPWTNIAVIRRDEKMLGLM